jgi:predicted DNA repair protein MutK
MAASSLLALIDDISTLLDDVAVLTKVAATKTTGVMGDDLALNAEQVSGVNVDRELPVVWAVAKGSFINKLILVPAALLISAFLPVAILPLMIIGGVFLCFEGVEKLAHKFLHRDTGPKPGELLKIVADPTVDLVAFETDKVKGAVRTDFVLSAEIVVITLGTMAAAPLLQQVVALSAVAIGATVLVYGLVAGIVKLDDLGLALHRQKDATAREFGAFILRAAPLLMKSLSVLGTAAMFTVGGSIIAHGIPVVGHFVEGVGHALSERSTVLAFVATTAIDALVGVAAGVITVTLFTLGQKVVGKKRSRWADHAS